MFKLLAENKLRIALIIVAIAALAAYLLPNKADMLMEAAGEDEEV